MVLWFYCLPLYANNTKACMPHCPIRAVPWPPSPRWNLSPFTHLTVWIMKYLFILRVKSRLPWCGSWVAPDGERPIGYDWDAVNAWVACNQLRGAGGGSCHTTLHHCNAGSGMSSGICGLWETKGWKIFGNKKAKVWFVLLTWCSQCIQASRIALRLRERKVFSSVTELILKW